MISINEKTRKWEIPYEEQTIGAQFDSDVCVKEIVFDRMTETGDDKSTGVISVLFVDSKGRKGSTVITDKTVGEDTVTIRWTIPALLTRTSGTCICAVCVLIGEQEWHSASGYFRVQPSVDHASGGDDEGGEDHYTDEELEAIITRLLGDTYATKTDLNELKEQGIGSGSGFPNSKAKIICDWLTAHVVMDVPNADELYNLLTDNQAEPTPPPSNVTSSFSGGTLALAGFASTPQISIV